MRRAGPLRRPGRSANRRQGNRSAARPNPELSVQVENFLGSGDFRGARSAELSVSVNQRLDIGGRRSARQSAAWASLTLAELDFAIARADLGQAVRQQFASAIAARERLRIAVEIEQRALELARVAQIFVDAGREPPLRALRARSAATQASATRQGAEADEAVARRTLAALFGVEEAPAGIAGMLDALPVAVAPGDTRAVLEVRRAEAQIRFAEAQLRQQEAQRTLDPAIGIGVRRLQGSRDQALLAGFSVPIPIRDNNSGNISSARAQISAARARLNGALATAAVRATEVALTAHLVMPADLPGDDFLRSTSKMLRDRFSIGHATIQIERNQAACELEPDDVV